MAGPENKAYGSWSEAQAASTGYDDPLISDLALTAALAVRRGEAAFERDTVLFHSPAHRWQLLACLASVAAAKGGRLHVADIGGSFASVYLQHRSFLDAVPHLTWSIVEQVHIAEIGRAHLQDDRLQFFVDVDEARGLAPIDMAVFSGSFQFMPEPYKMLRRIAGTGVSHLLIDRIALMKGDDDWITVYHVHAEIYPASYPQWMLSEARLIAFLSDELGFHEIARYRDGIDGDDHVGLFFARDPSGRGAQNGI